MLKKDHHQFLLAWLRNPIKVGIMVPSSRALGKAMASNIDFSRDGYVVELGAGTGAVTEELLHAGLKQDHLVILELDQKLCQWLQRKYPKATVIRGNAANISSLLEERNIHDVRAVVSSLPLLNMPHELRERILEESFAVLSDNGSFIQYTYGLKSPVAKNYIRRMGWKAEPTKRVWRNFPPARVWRFTAEESRQAA